MNRVTTAFVFPGQGSQSVGMLCDLANHHAGIIDLFTRVSSRVGYDVWQLVQQGPEATLNRTEYTQVAVLTADVAVYQLLQQQKPTRAVMMAGHSLGEYAALVCAGALSLEDAANLVAQRGRFMQATVPMGLGAMAAIVGLTDAQVQTLCKQASSDTEQVTPANYNAIGQVVIAGHTVAVEKAILLAEALNARLATIIPVSVPCHCPLLTEAAALFEVALHEVAFKTPELPVVSNVDLSIYQSPDTMRALLKAQLYTPVRWVETIQLMKNKGVERVIECGPGKVLSGLIKRIDKSIDTISVSDPRGLDHYMRIA